MGGGGGCGGGRISLGPKTHCGVCGGGLLSHSAIEAASLGDTGGISLGPIGVNTLGGW